MRCKTVFIYLSILSVLFIGCGQNIEYGKQPLVLDDFDFNLNLDRFFKDETIFGGNNKAGYSVSSEEYRFEADSLMKGVIQYSTNSTSTSRTLATFAGVRFESLGLLTDWDDKHVLLVCAETAHARAKDIKKIVDELVKEFGEDIQLSQEDWFGSSNTILTFQKGARIAKLSVYLKEPLSVINNEPDHNSFFSENEEKKEKRFHAKEILPLMTAGEPEDTELKCNVFYVKEVADKAIAQLESRSGFMTAYK